MRVSCCVSPVQKASKNNQNTETCNSAKISRALVKQKSSKKVRPLCRERIQYTMDLDEIQRCNARDELGKPESLRPRQNISWTEREQKAWLYTYSTFLDKRQLTKESCKWKAFSKNLMDEFGVDKDNIQCSKQVTNCLSQINYMRSRECQGDHATLLPPPPPACKNRPKIDGLHAPRLIFYVYWTTLSEVS